MADGGGDIIIKGGSVHVQFDPTMYEKDTADPAVYKHTTRKITRVLVQDEKETPRYDSGNEIGELKWTVTVYTSE